MSRTLSQGSSKTPSKRFRGDLSRHRMTSSGSRCDGMPISRTPSSTSAQYSNYYSTIGPEQPVQTSGTTSSGVTTATDTVTGVGAVATATSTDDVRGRKSRAVSASGSVASVEYPAPKRKKHIVPKLLGEFGSVQMRRRD